MFDASRYEDHFEKTYGGRYDFDMVAPAYEYGEQLRARYGSDWSAIEDDAMRRWEEVNPGTWPRFKDAVLEGWKR